VIDVSKFDKSVIEFRKKELKKAIEEASTREYLFQNATATLEERATKLSIANLICYI
jgi:F0F1-type ATP synthase epsilon subunit